jgi:CRP-like cAMP-binding protein
MSGEDNIQRLSRLRIFSKIEPGALRLLAFAAETRQMRAGDILFRQGDVSDCGYLLLSGAVTLEGATGGEPFSKVVKEGDLLGETALVVATKRPVTAIARQHSTVLRISRALFLRVLEEYPASAERLRRDLLAQINALGDDLEAFRRSLIADNSAAS